MKGLLHNKVVITIALIAFILILGLVGFRLYLVNLYKPLEAKITAIEIKELENTYLDRGFLINELNLNSEQADDIMKNPLDYRFIVYQCKLKNNSTFATVFRQKYDPLFSKEMQERILYNDKDFPTYNVLPKETSPDAMLTLVKLKEGDTDDSLMELAKKDKLILTVGKHSNVGANNMGSYSIELKYEGK